MLEAEAAYTKAGLRFEPHAVAAYRVFVGDGVHVLFERVHDAATHELLRFIADARSFPPSFSARTVVTR